MHADLRQAKVLALLPGEYFSILKEIYRYGKQHLEWRIFPLIASDDLGPYAALLSSPMDKIVLPDIASCATWEKDQRQVARIRALMADCEIQVDIPIYRLLLANERSIGRAYAKTHYYWPEREIAQRVLKDSRWCDIALMRLFQFAWDVIERYRPDFCLGSPTGGLFNTVFYYVTTHQKIPYLACNATLVTPGCHFWASQWGSFIEGVDERFKQYCEEKRVPSIESLQYVERFQEAPKPLPHYQQMWQQRANRLSFIHIHYEIASRVILRMLPIIKRQRVTNPKPLVSYVIDRYRNYWLYHRQKKYYRTFSAEELSKMNYIYYPFHLDPEIVLNVQAPFWHNQYNTIRLLSYNLPFGFRLLVREHRYNVGRRPTRYLRELARLPGVIWIDAFDDQYKYIRQAKLVVTVNGTSGFEGILLRRPVFTLDRTFYDALSIATRFDSRIDFGTQLLRAIHNPLPYASHYNERIALFMDAEKAVVLPRGSAPEEEVRVIQDKLIN